jgi:hypothetical protein
MCQENLGLVIGAKNRQASLGYFWISKNIVDRHILDSAADSTFLLPLYLYTENK